MEKEIEGLKNMILFVVLPILLLADFCAFVNLLCQPSCTNSTMKFIFHITWIIAVLTYLVIPAINWWLDRCKNKRRGEEKKNEKVCG